MPKNISTCALDIEYLIKVNFGGARGIFSGTSSTMDNCILSCSKYENYINFCSDSIAIHKNKTSLDKQSII